MKEFKMIKTKRQLKLFRLKRIAEMEGAKVCIKDKPHLTGQVNRVCNINLSLPIKDALKNCKYFVLFDNTLDLTPIEFKYYNLVVL
jgi:hypothetical protein